MLSILTREAPAQDLEALNNAIQAEVAAPEKAEFEIVLGRLQVASVMFVGVVILVIFSAASYLAGRASAPRKATEPAAQAPILEATIVKPAAASPAPEKPSPKREPPIFIEPIKGAVYLQMGAVDDGIATLLVEGLRKRGFQASAAAGPNEKIFRVLIGPFPDTETYNFTRDAINQIGVITFIRKYEP